MREFANSNQFITELSCTSKAAKFVKSGVFTVRSFERSMIEKPSKKLSICAFVLQKLSPEQLSKMIDTIVLLKVLRSPYKVSASSKQSKLG